MLQEGIFHQSGTSPPHHFGMMFLRVNDGHDATKIGSVLTGLWQLYQNLKQGIVPNLPGIRVPVANLNVSIGYGPNLFKINGIKRTLPKGLSNEFQFRSVSSSGGNRILLASGLTYEKGLNHNPATEEVMVQFLGDTPLSINRPMVETWKLLQNTVDSESELPILSITAFYTGFHREDRRSWIDFHDGISNPRKGQQRIDVVAVKERETPPADTWTIGGTYMSYMRLPIRMDIWHPLSLSAQELLVGRDKVTGCAIESVASDTMTTVSGCPFSGTQQVTDIGNEEFREPPDGVDAVLKKSHVQRSNHHRQDFDNPESLRIYRQGYEFAETTVSGLPRVGLNFVGFHDTPFRIRELLTRATWLGGVNFGGEITDSTHLIEVAAAGIYLMPPVIENEPFPGATIFTGTVDSSTIA